MQPGPSFEGLGLIKCEYAGPRARFVGESWDFGVFGPPETQYEAKKALRRVLAEALKGVNRDLAKDE